MVETSRTITVGGSTVVTYQPVDTLAPDAPDAHGLGDDNVSPPGATDTDENPESIVVRANIPTVKAYSHIHFGVWAGLKEVKDGDNNELAGLGIGFVQNFSGSGMTEKQGSAPLPTTATGLLSSRGRTPQPREPTTWTMALRS